MRTLQNAENITHNFNRSGASREAMSVKLYLRFWPKKTRDSAGKMPALHDDIFIPNARRS